MARITEEQKAANREVSLLKKAAHSARGCELRAAEEAVGVIKENTQLAREYEAAQSAADAARNALRHRIIEIRAQIALLEDQIKVVSAEHNPQIEKLDDLRRQAAEKKRAESVRLLKEAQSGFPDMQLSDARWSSSIWVPPEGYVERFAAEHAEELARKKARRDAKAKKVAAKKVTA